MWRTRCVRCLFDTPMQFTTLIPAYKPKYLLELLTALRHQTVKPAKIVFSDDSPNQAFMAMLEAEPLKSAVADLHIEVIRGPQNGGYNNFRHLFKYYAAQGDAATELFHVLLDDDILYPSFYERHLQAHQSAHVQCVVSRRWTANEGGQPLRDDLPVPPAFANHPLRMLAIETDVLFTHTVGSSSNWLGEFSNTTFRRAMALELVDTSMVDISFAGLEDLGAFLKAGLHGPIGFINDHLGYFRLSAEQNSANPMGRPLKLAFLAYIALAITARKLGRLTEAQCAAALQRTCPFVLHHYGQQEDMAALCALMLRLAQGDAAAEAEFLTQWAFYSDAQMQKPAAPVQRALEVPAISLLIPIYNGAVYLAKTLDAVLAQTFSNFEVLCIDDGSSDTSLELLLAYAARDDRVRVVSTPHNLGCVPKVLNFALSQMRGAYFVYASQDDLFSVDWLASMHARALETGADAVIPDLVFYYENESQRSTRIVGLHGNRSAVLSGREAAQHSLDWVIPCNALWNAALVQRVGYADFAYNADEYSGRVFFLNCNKVAFSGGEFWYRQDNAGAVTKKITYQSFDAAYTFFKLYLLLREHEFAPEVYAKEALKAMRTLEQMQQWLRVAGPALSDYERNEAQQRAQRCEQALREHGIYDIFASEEATV